MPENHTETGMVPASTAAAPAPVPAKKPRKPRAAKPKAEKAPKLDAVHLRRVSGEILQFINQDMNALVDRLIETEGMRVRTAEDGHTHIACAGIRASHINMRLALTNWGNAARRKLLEIGA